MNAEENNNFRDHIGTVDQSGKRVWVYPQKPKGQLYQWRIIVSFFQIGILIGIPFLQVNGHPVLLFQVLERKLYFFGHILRPQDSFLIALILITTVVFIFLFTAIFGRVWCGWLCPQTVFMEMVFRRIEYLIEGDFRAQQRLNQMELNFEKFFKKSIKHSIFFLLSFLIGNIFLAYIIGINELYVIINDPVSKHFSGFVAMLIFSFVFYGVFSWFREQACLMVCPYGRFQSVLQDKNTMMISYDYVRGEPRGKIDPNNPSIGDCVNCKMCVNVCPTGIDIRNGLQMECVNCTACIDSCNSIMEKLGKPKGLIRYASETMIETSSKFKLNKRIIAYATLFILLNSLLSTILISRADIKIIATRIPGMRYSAYENGDIYNVYNIKIINNTFEKKNITLDLLGHKGTIEYTIEDSVLVPADSSVDIKCIVVISPDQLLSRKTPIQIGVFENKKLMNKKSLTFLGP